MEDVIELYTTPPAPGTAVICFDETPRQLVGEARVPVRAETGRRTRYDYEYRRNGTANFTDVLFRSRANLEELMPRLCQYGTSVGRTSAIFRDA